MTEAGIRELRAHLSACLRRVEAGKTLLITRRDQPIGCITPAAHPIEAQLDALRRSGLIAWNGQRLQPRPPAAEARGGRTVADLLVADRR